MSKLLAIGTLFVTVTVAAPPALRGPFIAANGVTVWMQSYDEAQLLFEAVAPPIALRERNYANVSGRRSATPTVDVRLVGNIAYAGTQPRHYDHAYFASGQQANLKIIDTGMLPCGDGSCAPSDDFVPCPDHCAYHERFVIELPRRTVKKRAENGMLTIRLHAKRGDYEIIKVPVAHLNAVREIAGREH